MSAELPSLLKWAWQTGHRFSSGCQVAPEVQAVAACVATAVAASSCAHAQIEDVQAEPAQQEAAIPATAEFPRKLPVPERFQCGDSCWPPLSDIKRPLFIEFPNHDTEERGRRMESEIKTPDELVYFSYLRWKENPSERNFNKFREAVLERNRKLEEILRKETEIAIENRKEAGDFLKAFEPFAEQRRAYKECREEVATCPTRLKETEELIVSISQINSIEPLALNMEIVPSAARPLVERYLQLDRQFCDGFPATANEFLKLKPKWESVTQNFGVLQRMIQTLDARFQQYGAFEAFYAMQDLVEFDGQFSSPLPPEVFAVINADFQRKTKLWWKYVREDVRGLGLVYDSFKARDEAARKKPLPKSFLPYRPGDSVIPYNDQDSAEF